MIIGDPYKFGFLIERVSDWEYPPLINGLMFFYLNKKAYPKELCTAALSEELPELLSDKSPLMKPKRNKRLFKLDSGDRFERIAALTFPDDIDKKSDLSYLVPFHAVNDSGMAVFTLTDEEQVIIMVGEWSEGKLLPLDERIVDIDDYESVVSQLKNYCDSLNIPKPAENKPKAEGKSKPKTKAAPKTKTAKVTVRKIKKT